VHRASFLDEVIKLFLDEVTRFGKKVEMVMNKGSKMKLTFQDGSTAEADAVIGCDGVKSRTRQVLLVTDLATYSTFTGRCAYRGMIPMEKAVAAVGEEFAKNSQIYLKHHRNFFKYVIIATSFRDHMILKTAFPIERGSNMNVVASQRNMMANRKTMIGFCRGKGKLCSMTLSNGATASSTYSR
jgi:salicylate hydroxylase